MVDALDEYFSSLRRAAERSAGSALSGTMIAPGADRIGSRTATSYPTPAGTIVWCDPALSETLRRILHEVTARAVTSEEFVTLAVSSGATLSGFGNNRVLVGGPIHADAVDAEVAVRRLDRTDSRDRTLLAELASRVSADDLDEADLDLDDLDPFIVGLLAGERLVAYGGGRPSRIDARFDDIAVLTDPDHRRRGLGARAVSEFVRHRLAADSGRRMLYRCTTENAGSNAIAESLSFRFAHTIGAVRFGGSSDI